jgi:hypothetical protein
MPKGPGICLKIMVSPVRIRVPPLLKYLQIKEKERASAKLPEPFDKSVSTAGSRKGLFSAAVAASCMPSVARVQMVRVILISEWTSIF